MYGADFFAYSATDTFLFIDMKTSVSNQIFGEKSSEQSGIQLWECAFVKMLTSPALAYQSGILAHLYACIVILCIG